MEIQYSKDSIILKNKSLSNVDKFVLEFVDLLKNHFRYVIVSGYVAILFGRSRGTEDIDILIEKTTKSEFFNFVSEIEDRYDFLNPEDREGLYEMLSEIYELFQNNIQRDEIEYWAKYFKIQDKLDNFW